MIKEQHYTEWYDISSDEMTLEQAQQAVAELRKKVYNLISTKQRDCDGCIHDKAVVFSSYPCSHCCRCYTDKYKSESGE